MNNIERTFKKLGKEGKKAFIPYIMSGDPSIEATKRYIADLIESGADMIELGVPFSDPLADGPTIQMASERALQNGITLRKVLALVKEVRNISQIPLILMTYYNPVFKYGIETFIKDASEAGVDGVIIPDLIPDEAGDFLPYARQFSLDTIFLLAPTSTEDRIKKVVKESKGFVYYVSITGITGARILMDSIMKNTLNQIRTQTNKPVAVGFGVSNPEDATAVASIADGVIVGSAIVRLIAEGKSITEFARSLRNAI